MRILAALLALLAVSCAGPAPAGDAEEGVKAAIVGMYSAFQEKKLDAVAPFMTEGSTCYDAATSQMLVGRKAVLDHFGAILARHTPDRKWKSEMLDLKVSGAGDLAVATYKISTGEGGEHNLAAVTHVFRKVGGRWLAVHLHRSWNSAH